jgi:hypothetical protein
MNCALKGLQGKGAPEGAPGPKGPHPKGCTAHRLCRMYKRPKGRLARRGHTRSGVPQTEEAQPEGHACCMGRGARRGTWPEGALTMTPVAHRHSPKLSREAHPTTSTRSRIQDKGRGPTLETEWQVARQQGHTKNPAPDVAAGN